MKLNQFLVVGLFLSLSTQAFSKESKSVNRQPSSAPLYKIEVNLGQNSEIVQIDYKDTLAKMINSQVHNEKSDLGIFFKKLKKDNEAFTFSKASEKLVSSDNILKVESNFSSGVYYTEYLVAIDAGFKSHSSTVAYLQCFVNLHEDGKIYFAIQEPVKVDIERN